MTKRPPLSKGETEVLKALWQIDKGSVGEIHNAMPKERQMDYSTVQTYVRRMESKGYISATRIGRNKIYRPKVRRTEVMQEAVDEFLDRVFDGQLMPMVRHLVGNREVSGEELKELMDIVVKLRQEQTDDAN